LPIEEVRLFLEKSHKLLILCHSNADPDALGGAIAIRRCLKDKDVRICCDGISKPAKMLLEALGEVIDDQSHSPDAILALDTSSPELLGDCKPMLGLSPNLAVVDHHSTFSFGDVIQFRETRTSNSELVWDLLGHPDDITARKALLSGILADTGHMKFADRHTMKTIYEILGEDIVFEEVYNMLREDVDFSKKIALIKSLQRMRVTRMDDFVLVLTNIGSHESFIANNILAIGADVALIVNDKKGSRIVGRARRSAVERGIDLSSIMEEIGKKHNGDGGGHPAAAGLMGIKDFKGAAADITKIIENIIKGKSK